MRYIAFATDYDGTIAHDGHVTEATITALEQLRASGRKLILVTGRDLPLLERDFDRLDLFDRVVAENGALLYTPTTRARRTLGEPPPPTFVDALRARGVAPIDVGEVIVATWQPHEAAVLDAIRELGLELQVIFNKGAVMVLPSGINKAAGLTAALVDLGLSAHSVLGIGDAENDHAFLSLCECAVATANALPTLKERADLVTNGRDGVGAAEIIARLIANDLADVDLPRYASVIGTKPDGTDITLRAYGERVMITGTSGSGKSTLTTGLLERITEHGYQFCLIDPEGDYDLLPGATVLGGPQRPPDLTEVFALLEQPEQNVVVNVLGVALEDRPAFFEKLMPHLDDLRSRTGRPHWLVIDEAHHLMPANWSAAETVLPDPWHNVVLISTHPELIAPAALGRTATMIAIGERPTDALAHYAKLLGTTAPTPDDTALDTGEALIWSPLAGGTPVRFRITPPTSERRRHQRKYAAGDMGEGDSFYFRGAAGKLNLRANNLLIFVQIADGIDDETWEYHLRQGDYAAWFAGKVKDDDLATTAATIAEQQELTPAASRAAIKQAIGARYTLPG